jgi:hypothetical protein
MSTSAFTDEYTRLIYSKNVIEERRKTTEIKKQRKGTRKQILGRDSLQKAKLPQASARPQITKQQGNIFRCAYEL